MPDPIVTSVVVDGVERWGSVDAEWMRKAQLKQTTEAPADKPAATEGEAGDATEDAPPSDGKNTGRRNR